MMVIFGAAGLLQHPPASEHLEAAALVSAEQQSEVLRRSASHYMLNNDRDGLYEMMINMADQPGHRAGSHHQSAGVDQLFDGPPKSGAMVDKQGRGLLRLPSRVAAAYTLEPLRPLPRLSRRWQPACLGIITPIENQPACSNAACHAHPASANAGRARHQSLAGQSGRRPGSREAPRDAGLSPPLPCWRLSLLVSWLFVWVVVHKPLTRLEAGTERVAKGELGYQIPVVPTTRPASWPSRSTT